MTSAQVVETSVTNNSSFQNYPHPDDHTIRTHKTPITFNLSVCVVSHFHQHPKENMYEEVGDKK